ncbi:MAG TPA: alpha/beta hydrolase [Euzebya sp.]|nr:alpha/beta hydrolase [Euzebya sp.]
MEWRQQMTGLPSGQVVSRHAGPPDAPPLLVLHDAGADTVDAPAWADLARDHHVVQLLLPGYRGSTPPPVGVGIGWVTDHLRSVMDQLGWPRAHVAGTSLGGWFAIELALAHPALVSGLTLCDPAGLHHPQTYLLALFADGRAAAGTEALLEQTMIAHVPDLKRPVTDMPPAVKRAVMAPYVSDMAAAALCSWNPWTPDPGMVRRLQRLHVPTTILWGERDALIPLAHGRAMARAIPDAHLEVVQGAGHLLPLEHPGRIASHVRA